MEKKIFREWKSSIRATLNAIWKFRNLCKTPFDRGFIGELLVLDQLLMTYESKLCASEDNTFVYEGSSNKKWDVSLTINKMTMYINAKATSTKDKDDNPKWVRQHALSFCHIDINPRTLRQTVGKTRKEDPNLFYVFVDVGSWIEHRNTGFFTLPHKKAAQIFCKKYHNLYNNKKKPRKSGSTDFWVECGDIKGYKDNTLKRILK